MARTIEGSVSAVALPSTVIAAIERPQVAIGMQLAQLQLLAQIVKDENAPRFAPDQQPAQDGRVSIATDGRGYYRPLLRVAQRTVEPLGPDVRFFKDAAGTVRLQFELREVSPPGIAAGAVPFNVRVDQVVLRWQGGQRVFDRPTLLTDEGDGTPGASAFTLLVGAELTAEEVQPIYLALRTPSAAAQLDVQLAYSFFVEQSAPPPLPGPRPPLEEEAVRLPPRKEAFIRRDHRRGVEAVGEVSLAGAALLPRVHAARMLVPVPALREYAAIGAVLEQAKQREGRPNYRQISFVRSVPFTFEPSLDQNRPIYSMLESDAALDEQWTDTDFGPIRKASFINTVYRLPDDVRLAYNAELGTPHVLPALYRDDDENVRVRVTLRVVPWHNPEQLVRLRDYLHRSSAGALAAPTITVGGYRSARLRLTSAFPEEIQAIGGTEIDIDLERGSEITLDLSLEYYRFVAELLTGPIGLTGEVSVVLDVATDGGAMQERVRRVPMLLSLSKVARLPFTIQVEQQVVSPTEVLLHNLSRAEVQIGGCMPRLLQYDTNSVVPIEVFDAVATTRFPAILAADATLRLDVMPAGNQGELLWNAVQIELFDPKLTQPVQEVLDRIHEIVPSGTLAWEIEVECPPLMNTLPERFNNLFRVEVEISRAGFAIKQVVLKPGQATGHITMQRTLREIVAADGGGIGSFAYRVRNIYNDHEGIWGQPRDGAGSSIAVFPNPPENDTPGGG